MRKLSAPQCILSYEGDLTGQTIRNFGERGSITFQNARSDFLDFNSPQSTLMLIAIRML